MLFLVSLLISLTAATDCKDCPTYHASLMMTDAANCTTAKESDYKTDKQKLHYNNITVDGDTITVNHVTCNEMPAAWKNELGTDLTEDYLSFTVTCAWNKAEKDVIKISSSVYSDNACKTKMSGKTLFADDYISGTCFDVSKEIETVATNVARMVSFDQNFIDLCMGKTPTPAPGPDGSAASGLFASVAFLTAAFAALF